MNKPVSTDLVSRFGADLSLAELDPASFSAALRVAQRQSFTSLGMAEDVFHHLVGSRSPEDRRVLAGRMQRLAQHLLSLASATERGSLEVPEEEALPWNSSLDALPNSQLRNALKQQFLVWAKSGLPIDEYMNGHHYFTTLWRSPS